MTLPSEFEKSAVAYQKTDVPDALRVLHLSLGDTPSDARYRRLRLVPS
jgi:hypothetical protein